jgi:hypothetical protein
LVVIKPQLFISSCETTISQCCISDL